MKTILAIGGSNSRKSINKTLAIYAASKIDQASIKVVDLNDYPMPIYSGEIEEKVGIPEAARQFDKLLDSADGIVISLAEHNGSYSAVFKNLLDWLSRIDIKVWKGKPMLLMATSPGRRGGATVLETAKSYFPFIEGNIAANYSLPSFYDHFSNSGIANKELAKVLDDQIALFERSLEAVAVN